MNTTYNINHNIKVRLTERGKTILDATDQITAAKLATIDLIYLGKHYPVS